MTLGTILGTDGDVAWVAGLGGILCLVGIEPAQLAQLVAVLRRAGSLAHITIIAAFSRVPTAPAL